MKAIRALLAAALIGFGGSAKADDFGCTVLLCLANPAGPMAVAQCVPPIKQLFKMLLRFKPFPTCLFASAPSSSGLSSWAEHGYEPYDPCPDGLTELPAGRRAVQGEYVDSFATGIGDGSPRYSGGEREEYWSPKVCVGAQVGEHTVQTGSGDNADSYVVEIYDRVVLLDKASDPHFIDVYVNSAKQRRIRVPY